MGNKNGRNNVLKQAFGKWFGLFLVILSAGFLYLVVENIGYIVSACMKFIGLIMPIIYGCVIAYLLNPIVKMYDRLFRNIYKKKKEPSKRMCSIIYSVSIVLALITGLLIIAVLCWLIIPSLITSVLSLINVLPQQFEAYYAQVTSYIENNKYIADQLQATALEMTDNLESILMEQVIPWLKSDLLPNVNTFAAQFANGVKTFLDILYNLFIGLIVAIYLLNSKKVFSAQAKKIAYGLLPKNAADIVIYYVRISDRMFSGFISGKIVDSAIIGVLCFLAMYLLKLPYAVLVSVIVGVTNVIPVFGPYIGAVPSALLILLVSPVQAVYFVILIVILQQLDGNIIGPMILGESTGLSAFWVLFSILLFGGIWGIAGMLVGCPLFAVIYKIVKDGIAESLRRKKLSDDTSSYINLKAIETAAEPYVYVKYTDDELSGEKNKEKNKEKGVTKFHDKVEKINKLIVGKTKKTSKDEKLD